MTADRERRFRRLYERHYPALLAYALRRTTGSADAHDVVADTFLVLWRRFSDAPSSDEEALLWLYGIARRVLANRHRTRQRQERLAQRFADALNQSTSTEDVATHRRDAQRLLEALLELSDSERELLMLAAWEQLSTSELARVLGCTENAAAIRLHRARKRLTEVYTKENDPSGHRTVERLRLRPSKKRK
ncbi:MAG TPA: sigma-70 family RNA polymerase sigma factor [Gaiellaceae bacterium]|nr:sigma-70 family RNA polymerase sigma factor [Gaiellaceae bacterium]